MKKRLIKIPEYHKLLWEITSIAYRLEDTGKDGMSECATCKCKLYYIGTRKAHMGHFVSRKRANTKYLRKNQLTQCDVCNGHYGNGEQYLMGLALDKKYGEGTALKMLELSKIKIVADRDFLRKHLIKNSILLKKQSMKKNLLHWQDYLSNWKVNLIDEIFYTEGKIEYQGINYKIPK